MSPQRKSIASPPPHWSQLSDLIGKTIAPPKDQALLEPAATHFFHRDLSWLQFNDRVLSEAANPQVPLLERIRFLGIVSSNLDEFFTVRVGELARLAKRSRPRFSDRSSPSQVLSQIRHKVLEQKARQAATFWELLPLLKEAGIDILSDFSANRTFDKDIQSALPKIKYLVRKFTEPLPPLESDGIHIFARFDSEYAILSIENRQERLITLPTPEKKVRVALLERWLVSRLADLFPGKHLIEAFPFKILRDADLRYRPDEEETLEEQITEAVQKRIKARIVRLEVDSPAYSDGAMFLAASLGLDSGSLYRFDVPLDLRTFSVVGSLDAFAHLRYPQIKPAIPPGFQDQLKIFETIRKRDYLLHHPYDSFDVIVWFLSQAAKDPQVQKIYHTLYRTSFESPIMEALKEAARNGKQVTVYIEIRARFDELNNIRWSNELKKAGVRVVRPMGGFKVHSKLTQVIREENGHNISYLHLGTGNYHPGTARLYTDLGMLTCDAILGEEVTRYFAILTKHEKPRGFHDLWVAPSNLSNSFEWMIREEMKLHKKSGRGHIIAKMNSLVDHKIIGALYEASRAGVKIELMVRGICCLRPGVKDLSENIRVVSVIDRFLEHSRIYYFRAGGAKRVYLSSADWMPRNFYMRYEISFPIKDQVLKKYIREVILAHGLGDNVKGWTLKPDGTYSRIPTPAAAEKQIHSQRIFEQMAAAHYKGSLLESRLKSLNNL